MVIAHVLDEESKHDVRSASAESDRDINSRHDSSRSITTGIYKYPQYQSPGDNPSLLILIRIFAISADADDFII